MNPRSHSEIARSNLSVEEKKKREAMEESAITRTGTGIVRVEIGERRLTGWDFSSGLNMEDNLFDGVALGVSKKHKPTRNFYGR